MRPWHAKAARCWYPTKELADDTRGALVEVSYVTRGRIASAEQVLSSYHLAGSFRFNAVIADPTGELTHLQRQVSALFAREEWVRRRCSDAQQTAAGFLDSIDTATPLHDQVTGLQFEAGVTTHVLLVAALRNPTVRLRYRAVRDVLARYDHNEVYEELLHLLGCADLRAERVAAHLHNLTRTFDAAAKMARTPFFFSSDITADARSIAIDGSRELILAGDHREAVFWITATFARCHKILAADAPQDAYRALAPAFEELLADLGITAAGDLLTRRDAVRRYLPRLRTVADEILSTNPCITTR